MSKAEDLFVSTVVFTGCAFALQVLKALHYTRINNEEKEESSSSIGNLAQWGERSSGRMSINTPSRCNRIYSYDGSVSPNNRVVQLEPLLKGKQLIPYSNEPLPSTVVVDCTHPTAFQLTHHVKNNTEKQRLILLHQHSHRHLSGDTSTAAVLNAILERDEEFMECHFVSTNHFDIDSFLSVFCCVNPHIAIKHEQLLRQCARIGDFREVQLPIGDNYDDDSIENCALRIVCWINSMERSKFPLKPFEATFSAATGEEGAMAKFRYFLDNFAFALEHIQAPLLKEEYDEEYQRVLDEYHYLHCGGRLQRSTDGSFLGIEEVSTQTSHQLYPGIGLCIVRAAEPLHYYSLFSLTLGYDLVLSCYCQNRYELEVKYTTYVDLISRRCRPRVDLTALAQQLNYLERLYRNGENPELSACSNNASCAAPVQWIADSITDSGPLLRLEGSDGPKLTKAQRYGHPYERPILSSAIPQTLVENLVVSYFEFAYSKCGFTAKRDWSWKEIHDFNRSIDWSEWDQYVSTITAD